MKIVFLKPPSDYQKKLIYLPGIFAQNCTKYFHYVNRCINALLFTRTMCYSFSSQNVFHLVGTEEGFGQSLTV